MLGESFQILRSEATITAAAQVLEAEPTLTVKEIAMRIGFPTSSAFAHFCERALDCSPTALRAGSQARQRKKQLAPEPQKK